MDVIADGAGLGKKEREKKEREKKERKKKIRRNWRIR